MRNALCVTCCTCAMPPVALLTMLLSSEPGIPSCAGSGGNGHHYQYQFVPVERMDRLSFRYFERCRQSSWGIMTRRRALSRNDDIVRFSGVPESCCSRMSSVHNRTRTHSHSECRGVAPSWLFPYPSHSGCCPSAYLHTPGATQPIGRSRPLRRLMRTLPRH
jgi:hypothetical protein